MLRRSDERTEGVTTTEMIDEAMTGVAMTGVAMTVADMIVDVVVAMTGVTIAEAQTGVVTGAVAVTGAMIAVWILVNVGERILEALPAALLPPVVTGESQ